MPENKSAPLQLVKSDHALIPNEIAEAYSLAMDQALGLQKTSLSAVSEWNAQAMELAWSFAPTFCELFGMTVRSIANCAEWARFMMGLPLAVTNSPVLQLAAAGTVVSESAEQAKADACARYMDIAIGAEGTVEMELEDLSVAAVLNVRADQLPLLMPTRQAEADEAAEAIELVIGQVA
jgi:hypothetical protein